MFVQADQVSMVPIQSGANRVTTGKADHKDLSIFFVYKSIVNIKNTVQAFKHPSADTVTQNVHKSDTTTSNTLCQ